MAKVVIGGATYVVPELTFMALERAWPFVSEAMVTVDSDPMRGPMAAMRIIAAGIMEDEDFQPEKYKVTATPDDPDAVHDQVVQFFRKKLKAREIPHLTECIDTILVEAGLMAEPGELQEVEEKASPSLETAPASSPNLLPLDARAEAGMA